MPEAAKWYVVHTYSGYESKVCTNLEKMVENRHMQDLILETKIPLETVTEIKDNKTREVEQKLFPGYVLVKMVMTDESWYVVRNTRGVTGFVGAASKPEPLSEAEINALGVETRSVKVDYEVGDSVEIMDGPFSGMTGVVDKIDTAEGRVRVMVFVMNRETPVDLAMDQITPV
ncbi:MAG TPA: transcription termination/antitermination protein NusG [Oscillospiraceae bacterium]|nr:transcription termination/antitermination protein NusG [Oscillospiraceae bacterium]HPK35302.1 transcription termination/antitermination protein NusG [Oscillospiraceae bacterium]HPR76829.1 transcription termination/antitermination protein NusG [Oscillospiraceae bacterium]